MVLVFDALGGGSGTVTRTTAKGAIDIVYVGDSEADTWIMLEVRTGTATVETKPTSGLREDCFVLLGCVCC